MYIYSMYSKELLKGTLNTMVLQLLSDHGRMYGYEIFQKVKELSDGKIILKDGSLYPALQKLTKDGILTFEEEYIGKRVRKYYFLTQKGKEENFKQIVEIKDFMKTLNRILFPEVQGS